MKFLKCEISGAMQRVALNVQKGSLCPVELSVFFFSLIAGPLIVLQIGFQNPSPLI